MQSTAKKGAPALNEWKQRDAATTVEELDVPAIPSAFPNAAVRVCGYELDDICGASSVIGSG